MNFAENWSPLVIVPILFAGWFMSQSSDPNTSVLGLILNLAAVVVGFLAGNIIGQHYKNQKP